MEQQITGYKAELRRKRDEIRQYIMRIPDAAEPSKTGSKSLMDRAIAAYQRKVPKEYEELLKKLETLLTDTTLECANLREQNDSLRGMIQHHSPTRPRQAQNDAPVEEIPTEPA